MGIRHTAGSYRSLELFTGAGGLAIGTHLAGFRHAALVELDKHACLTLADNVSRRSLRGIARWRIYQADVATFPLGDLGPVDLVAGGPPCQPFSIAGKHGGMEDPRDSFPAFIRAVRTLAPKAFIVENVRGLLRPEFRRYFNYVELQLAYPTVAQHEHESWYSHLERLEDLHTSGRTTDLQYKVVWRPINAADYGIPQVRHRVFLVGFRSDVGLEWHFPKPSHSLDTLLYDQWVSQTYWTEHGLNRPTHSAWPGRVAAQLPIAPDPNTVRWQTVRDALSGLPEPRADSDIAGIDNHRLIPGARSYRKHTGSPLDLPAKTLKAGAHGVPGGENMVVLDDGTTRYFTIREAARLQTFPDEWCFDGIRSRAFGQLGNAVPVELARIIGDSVAAALTGITPAPLATRSG